MFRKATGAQGLDLLTQLAGDTFVRVNAQNPVMTGAVDGELFLRTVPGPIALDDTGSERAGNLARRIRGMRINDEDLVAKAHGPQARLDPIRLVVRDNAGGQLHWHRIPLMSSVLFYDPSCQRPYDTRTLQQQATGGTEASVTRIADALGAIVMQHNRTEIYGRYRPPERVPGVTHVILNRDSRALPLVRELYPKARVYLWVHDHFRPGSKRGRRLASTSQLLREMSVTIVCVSDQQRRGVEAMLQHMGVEDRVSACTI